MRKQTFRQLAAVSFFLLMIPVEAAQLFGAGSSPAAFSADEIAAAKNDPLRFTLDPDSVKLVRKRPLTMLDMDYIRETQSTSGAKNPVIIIAEIVNIAVKVWDIIKDNAPVVDINTKYASAVPSGIGSWTQLNGWKKPSGYSYSFSAINGFGAKWVDVEYKVLFTSGGKYMGKGKYLTGVTIIPSKVDVNWGTHVTLSAEVPDSTIVNIGTSEDPVAAMQLVLTHRMSTVMSNLNGTEVYYINGYGDMQEITGKSSAQNVKDIESAAPLLGDLGDAFR